MPPGRGGSTGHALPATTCRRHWFNWVIPALAQLPQGWSTGNSDCDAAATTPPGQVSLPAGRDLPKTSARGEVLGAATRSLLTPSLMAN